MPIPMGKYCRSDVICEVVDDLFDGHVASGRPWKKIVKRGPCKKIDNIYIYSHGMSK